MAASGEVSEESEGEEEHKEEKQQHRQLELELEEDERESWFAPQRQAPSSACRATSGTQRSSCARPTR
eukprot:9364500-Pyramimonas_sp.AAC.1